MAERPYFITQTEYEGGFRHFPTLIQAAGPRVQNGDWLALTLTTSDATGSVEINGRILTDQAEIVPFTQLMTFSGTGSQTAIVARLGGGWLQGFSVHRVSGTLTDGEVVAAVHLGTGEGATARYECCLASGEITNIRSLGMGAFLIRGPEVTTTTTVTAVIATAAPAAGVEMSFTVTAAQAWEIFSMQGKLVTSATVATRTVAVRCDDTTNKGFYLESTTTQTATVTKYYNFSPVGAMWTAATSNIYMISIPPVILPAGARIRTDTSGLQATDQWSECTLVYRQYSA